MRKNIKTPIINRSKNMLKPISFFINQKTEDSTHLFFPFGVLTAIGYPIFYVLNKFSGNNYENLELRLMAILLAIPLIFHNQWPKQLEKFKAFYWYCSVTYIAPYFFTFMLLKNPNSVEWQLNVLIVITLVILLFDWVSVTFITIIGILFGIVSYYLTDPNPQFPQHLGALINTIVSLLVYCALFSHKNESIQQNRKIRLKISEQVNDQLEHKVQERTLELQKALAAKTEFLNNMSHEVRTPIQGFTTISEGLVEHWNSFDENKRLSLAKIVASSAQRLATLVTNLLDLSKFTANKMLLDIKMIDLVSLIEEIIKECEELYINNKIIKIEFIKPPCAPLMADKERIEQVLRNLFANAIKFSSDHSIIKVSIILLDDKWCFSLTDEGIGIPEDELKAIFDSFTQSTRTKTGAGGTGLGLSICKQIIEAHDGKIWAENNIGNGSSFHFIIPTGDLAKATKEKEMINIDY